MFQEIFIISFQSGCYIHLTWHFAIYFSLRLCEGTGLYPNFFYKPWGTLAENHCHIGDCLLPKTCCRRFSTNWTADLLCNRWCTYWKLVKLFTKSTYLGICYSKFDYAVTHISTSQMIAVISKWNDIDFSETPDILMHRIFKSLFITHTLFRILIRGGKTNKLLLKLFITIIPIIFPS